MTLIRRNQSQPVFTNFFDDFLNKEWSDWGLKNYSRTNTTIPSVNISENDENFLIEVAAPGLDKSDFSIEVNQGTLKISSEIKSENQEKEDRYTRREFSYQSFCRSFSLPLTVDSDKIEAKYDKGILLVTIPKREEAKPKPVKMIDIK
ncbi:MAG: Hsp20/alpha crystallin family protein [Bacteroidales bacterium]|jgi:HSP20 family protein|nr:Hsp20/alpha crystallin family protein [Bacteroidales bacterium]